jgi:hypothetical protein
MALPQPAEHTDPMGRGRSIDIKKERERLDRLRGKAEGMFKQYGEAGGITSRQVAEQAVKEVQETLGDRPIEFQRYKAKQYAQHFAETYNDLRDARKRAVVDMVKDGGLARPEYVTLTPEQEGFLQSNQSFKLNESQAWYEYLRGLDDEDMLRFLSGKDDGAKAAIAKLQEEERWEQPHSLHPVMEYGIKGASYVPNIVESGLTGVYKTAREHAPADPEIRSSEEAESGFHKFAMKSAASAASTLAGMGPMGPALNAALRAASPDDPKDMAPSRDVMKSVYSVTSTLLGPVGSAVNLALRVAQDPENPREALRPVTEMAGVDMPELAAKIVDDPSIAGEIFKQAADNMATSAAHPTVDLGTRSLARYLDGLNQNVHAAARKQAVRELGTGAKPEQIQAKTEMLANDAMAEQTMGFMIRHPYLTTAAATVMVPSLPFSQAKGLVKGATAAYSTGRSSKVAMKIMGEPRLANATKARMTEFLERNRAAASALSQSLEQTDSMKKFRKLTDKIRFMPQFRRLGHTEVARKVRFAAAYAHELMSGQLDKTRVEMFRDVHKLLKVQDEKDNLLLMHMLDDPWAIARPDDDIAEAYGMLIDRMKRSRISAKDPEDYVNRLVKHYSGKRSRAFSPEQKEVLASLTDEQKKRIADLYENPEQFIDVPEHLQDAYQAGVRLAKADQNLKELAGTMNVVRRTRAHQKMKRKKMTPEQRAQADLEPVWQVQLNRFRRHYVPRTVGMGDGAGSLGLGPVLRTAKHKSALARKLTLDEALARGLDPSPGKQWQAHVVSALPKYETGMRLRAIDEAVRAPGRNFAIRLETGDPDGAARHAEKMSRLADKALEKRGEALKVAQHAQKRADAVDRKYKTYAARLEAAGEEATPELRGYVNQLAHESVSLNEKAGAAILDAQNWLGKHAIYRQTADIAATKRAMRQRAALNVDSELHRLQQVTGTKWVNIADRNNMNHAAFREYMRVTSKAGQTVDNTAVLVPEAYASYVQDVLPFIGGKGSMGAAVEALDALANATIRPLQSAWRLGVTVPRMLYTAKNFVSSVGLGYVALGARAFDPELQAKVMLGSMAQAAGENSWMRAAVGGQKFTMRNGEQIDMSQILDMAEKLRITSQIDPLMGIDVNTAKGLGSILPETTKALGELTEGRLPGVLRRRLPEKAQSLAEMAEVVTTKVSPMFHAKWTENYQRLLTFMGFLEDFSEDGIAKAFMKSAKWSSNYNMLGAGEKAIFRDMFGFYGWHRFIVPHIVRMTVERPEQLARIIRMRGDINEYTKRYNPIQYEFMPQHQQIIGMPGMPQTRPSQFTVDQDVAFYSAMVMEDPLSLTMAYMPYIEFMMSKGAKGKEPTELLGPAMMMMTDVLTMRDQKGRPAAGMFKMDRWESPNDSLVWRYFMMPVEASSKPFRNIYELYNNEPVQNSMQLKLMVGRQWLGLDNHVARMFGHEGRSVGGMTDPETGGMLGASQYPVDYLREINRKKSAAVGRAGDVARTWEYSIKRQRGF